MIEASLTNLQQGPRGVWSLGSVVDIKPGETRTLSFADEAEFGQVSEAMFTVAREDSKPLSQGPVPLTGKNKDQLLAIAASEDVEIEAGATNNDIISAIELHREAAAAT